MTGLGACLLVLAINLGAPICTFAAASDAVRLRRPLQVATVPGSAPPEPIAPYPSTALAPGASPLASDALEPQLLGPATAPQPRQNTRNGTAVGVLSSTSSDTAYCTDSTCGTFGPGSCSDATAALNTRLNYIYQSTLSCGSFNAFSQYQCCVQTCSTDNDCPSQYYCQSGFANSAKYCSSCDACSTTTVPKCQADLGCTFPCCLSPYGGCAGSTPSSMTISNQACCPTTLTLQYNSGGSSCTCSGAPQTCPSSPPPPPSAVHIPSPPPPQVQQYVPSLPPPSRPPPQSTVPADSTSNSGSSNSGSGSCFPGNAMALTPKGPLLMKQLSVGDKVLTIPGSGWPKFEEVFMFSHRTPNSLSPFVTLFTDSGANITASPGHYIWAATGFKGSVRPVRAQDIRIGDCLIGLDDASASPARACVVGKAEALELGLYNPHTPSGSIVVNGIGALTFTDTLPPSLVVHKVITTPARLVYMGFKAVGGTALVEVVNNLLLCTYFGVPSNIWLHLMSGK